MLSCHPDPFTAFVKDLQMYGTQVHLYRGPNVFGCVLMPETAEYSLDQYEKENVYFLAGVNPGLAKRAADSDVLWRGMFTLDFDIRKELEKNPNLSKEISKIPAAIEEMGNIIVESLEKHPLYGRFRYVVMSGNGMHVHYFGEPCTVVKEQWVAGMKNVFEEVATLTPIPPDYGCGNAGRIIRMPGSWNVKDPANKKPVDVMIWMPGYSTPPMQFVQERGKLAIAARDAVAEAQKAEFVDSGKGESDVIALINSIPVEQVIAQLFAGVHVSRVKKDGGMRFADEKGVERGFFRHCNFNIIVHEGTALFAPPVGVGYNPLGLVKTVKGLNAHDAIQWFCERSAKIREVHDAEKAEWKKENTGHDWRDLLPENLK